MTKDSHASAVGIAGLAIGIFALFVIIIVAWCILRYIKNRLYVFSDHIWFLDVKLREAEPLLAAENGCANGQVEPTEETRNAVELEDVEAVLRQRLPRYSVVFKGQSVDVFADVRMSQVYCIAQDYFQNSDDTPSTSTSSTIAVESMDVYPISNSRRDNRSRPLSFLNDSDEDVVMSGNVEQTFPGMYLSKKIGPDGGSISIQGARLTIPVGALSVTHNIRIGVIWKAGGGPPLDKQQALLSSVVACEPHGLEFEIPVNLEIQHCAQSRKEWELYIMRSNTSVRETADWKKLSTDDFTNRTFGQNSIGLRLRHFSQYAVLGTTVNSQVATKMIKLVAFAPPVQPNQPMTVRVYCVDEYDSNSLDRQEQELPQQSQRVHPPQPLYIRNTGANVCVQLTDVPSQWTVNDGRIEQEFDFDTVWHSGRPVTTFTLRQSTSSEEFMCRLVGFQKDQPNKKTDITIVQRRQIPQTDAIRKTIKDRDRYDRARAIATTSDQDVFPLNLRTELIRLLEPDDRLHNNNWLQVANHLKLPYREILWLESQRGTRYGPMELLLQMWESENKTLAEFTQLMKDIRRMDVVTRIEHYQIIFGNDQSPPATRLDRLRKTLRGIAARRRNQTTARHDITHMRVRFDPNPAVHAYVRQTSSEPVHRQHQRTDKLTQHHETSCATLTAIQRDS